MSTMNLSLPGSMESRVDERVSRRRCGTGGECLRESMRKDRDRARPRRLLSGGAPGCG
jgi:Arc/MetJ-type ribon-helix-helix transcriptional regulator